MGSHKGSKTFFNKQEPQCHEVVIYCDGGFLGAPQAGSLNCKSNVMNVTGIYG